MSTHRITNTARLGADVLLADALVLGSSEAIEMSERTGQAELLASETLPTDTHDKDEQYEALGFTFGEPVDGDPMFRAATLPAGWARKGSGHAMWSYIYDAEGFQRVSIFYKAAFYDRSAHMGIVHVPSTDAQRETIGKVYESLPRQGEPWWGDMREQAREDRAIVATWKLREINPYPAPEKLYATRTVVVLPDGSIESDVVTEEAPEVA